MFDPTTKEDQRCLILTKLYKLYFEMLKFHWCKPTGQLKRMTSPQKKVGGKGEAFWEWGKMPLRIPFATDFGLDVQKKVCNILTLSQDDSHRCFSKFKCFSVSPFSGRIRWKGNDITCSFITKDPQAWSFDQTAGLPMALWMGEHGDVNLRIVACDVVFHHEYWPVESLCPFSS